MHKYYRYRPDTELSIKELIYGELYFASREELNDPFDTRIKFKFENRECFRRLLEIVTNNFGPKIEWDLDRLVDYFAGIKPDYEKLIGSLEDQETIGMFELAIKSPVVGFPRNALAGAMCRHLMQYIRVYIEDFSYVSAFSGNNHSTLLWSHYASQHKGFCLQFTSVEGKLFQNPFNQRKEIKSGRHISTSIPESFEFNEVKYGNEPGCLNGFESFPTPINNINFSTESDRLDFWKIRKEMVLKKYEGWRYEEEYRLLFKGGSPWISGRFGTTKFKRLFYYDQTQLTGIIFGERMHPDRMVEIEEILTSVREKLLNGIEPFFLPPFIFKKASVNPNEYKMDITPIKCLDSLNEEFKYDENSSKIESYKLLHRNWKLSNDITVKKPLPAHLKSTNEYFDL